MSVGLRDAFGLHPWFVSLACVPGCGSLQVTDCPRFRYENRSIAQGKEHPGNIVESSSLAAVALPDATYPLFDALPSPVVEEGEPAPELLAYLGNGAPSRLL